MTSGSIVIQLNGKPEQIRNGITVKELLESRGVNPNTVACELNLNILKRATLGTTVLNERDTLEVIQMIGGG